MEPVDPFDVLAQVPTSAFPCWSVPFYDGGGRVGCGDHGGEDGGNCGDGGDGGDCGDGGDGGGDGNGGDHDVMDLFDMLSKVPINDFHVERSINYVTTAPLIKESITTFI